MFGIASRYVKARIKAPAFNISCKYNPFVTEKDTIACAFFLLLNMQGKALLLAAT